MWRTLCARINCRIRRGIWTKNYPEEPASNRLNAVRIAVKPVDPEQALQISADIEIKGDKETLWIDLRQPIQIKFSTERPKSLVQQPLPKKPKDQYAPHEFSV